MGLTIHIHKYVDIHEMVNEEGAEEHSSLRGWGGQRKLPTGGSILELESACPRRDEPAPTKHPG